MLKKIKLISMFFLCFMVSTINAAPIPAITYQSMLNTYFDDKSGLIRIGDIDLVFAPKGDINASVAIVNSKNKIVKNYKFYPTPRFRDGVFARLTEVGPAEFNLTDPGIYNMVFLFNGKAISRLPIKLEETYSGKDPFNPEKTYRYTGLWQIFAFLTTDKLWKGKRFPELHLWLGGKDLAKGTKQDMFKAVVKRGGKIIAHSKETQGHITNKHYQDTSIRLYHPHTRNKIANAIPFDLSDWTQNNGSYSVEVYRKADGARIRSFNYRVKDKKIISLKATQLNYKKHIDYIVPRVTVSSSKYKFVEAIWLKSSK